MQFSVILIQVFSCPCCAYNSVYIILSGDYVPFHVCAIQFLCPHASIYWNRTYIPLSLMVKLSMIMFHSPLLKQKYLHALCMHIMECTTVFPCAHISVFTCLPLWLKYRGYKHTFMPTTKYVCLLTTPIMQYMQTSIYDCNSMAKSLSFSAFKWAV
jgi:hypothetical protein